MWLAKEVEHTVDVDGMLERMEPKQFQEWVAMFRICHPAEENTDGQESAFNAMRRMTGV